MIHELMYYINTESIALDESEVIKCPEFPYFIEEDVNDVVEYLFEKKYGKEYDNSWMLEDDALNFVIDIENKWFDNKIDLYSDRDFYCWLVEKYANDALEYAMLLHENGNLEDYIDRYYESKVNRLFSISSEGEY